MDNDVKYNLPLALLIVRFASIKLFELLELIKLTSDKRSVLDLFSTVILPASVNKI